MNGWNTLNRQLMEYSYNSGGIIFGFVTFTVSETILEFRNSGIPLNVICRNKGKCKLVNSVIPEAIPAELFLDLPE